MNRRDRKLISLLSEAWPDAALSMDGRGERAVIRVEWPNQRWVLVGARSLNDVWEVQTGFRCWTFHEYERKPWTRADVAAWIKRVNEALADPKDVEKDAPEDGP